MPGRNVRWAQTDTTASSRAGDSFNEENSEIEDVSEDAEVNGTEHPLSQLKL